MYKFSSLHINITDLFELELLLIKSYIIYKIRIFPDGCISEHYMALK